MSEPVLERAPVVRDTVRQYLADSLSNRFVMWAAFIVVHLWLGLVNLYSPTNPIGDVRYIYSNWMDQALQAQYWVGIDTPWVYPIAAILPMLAAEIAGRDLYTSSWLVLVLLLDAVALATLTGWGRRARNLAAGWWWVLFLVVLGPISVARIDSISVPLAVIGVVILAAHPIAGSVILSLATWIKVWPAAIIGAFLIVRPERRAILVSAVATSVGIIAISLAFGAGANTFGFITQQTGRGLEVEAPVATFWMWQAFVGVAGSSPYYDLDILAFQVMGNGVDATSAAMTPIMFVATTVVAVLGWRAMRRRAGAELVAPVLVLALLCCLFVFNKVGSPQYLSWFIAPVLLAMISGPASRRAFRLPAALILVIAALTQLIYPFFFNELLALNPGMLVVLTVRNLLLVGLLGWTISALWRLRGAPELR